MTTSFNFFGEYSGLTHPLHSFMAPKFDVRGSPSKWDRQIRAASQKRREGLSERGQLQSEFWEYYSNRYPDDGIREGLAGTNAYHNIPNSEIRISQFVMPKRNAVGIFIGKQSNPDSGRSVFELASRYGDALMSAWGLDPKNPPPSFTADCGRYYAQVLIHINDFEDRANWAEATDWLHEALMDYLEILTWDA